MNARDAVLGALIIVLSGGCAGVENPDLPPPDGDADTDTDTDTDTDSDTDTDIDSRVGARTPAGAKIVFNELLAHQTSEGYEDFAELLNVSDEVVDLSGWRFDDDGSEANGTTFVFPSGTTLAPGEMLIVWCKPDEPIPDAFNGLFGLGRNADEARLFDTEGNLIDHILWSNAVDNPGVFGRQESDIAIGRLPDGGVTWAELDPTPGQPNRAL